MTAARHSAQVRSRFLPRHKGLELATPRRLMRPDQNDGGDATMKAFLLACIAAVVLALGGWAMLNNVQETSKMAFTTSGARI